MDSGSDDGEEEEEEYDEAIEEKGEEVEEERPVPAEVLELDAVLRDLDGEWLEARLAALRNGHDAPVEGPIDGDGDFEEDGATVFVEAFEDEDKRAVAEQNIRRRLLWMRVMQQHAAALGSDLDAMRVETRAKETRRALWQQWRVYNAKSRHFRRKAERIQARCRGALDRRRVAAIKKRCMPALELMYRVARRFLSRALLQRKRERRRYLTPLVAMLNLFPERLIPERSTRVDNVSAGGKRRGGNGGGVAVPVPDWVVPHDPLRKWKRMTAVLCTGNPAPIHSFDSIWEASAGNATSYLTPPSLVACECVCRAWRNMLHDPVLAKGCWRNWLWLPKASKKRRRAIAREVLQARRRGDAVGTGASQPQPQPQRRVELDSVLHLLESGAMAWRTAVASQRVAVRLERVAARASLALGKKSQRLKQPHCALPDWQTAAAKHGGAEAAAVRSASVARMWTENEKALAAAEKKAARKTAHAAKRERAAIRARATALARSAANAAARDAAEVALAARLAQPGDFNALELTGEPAVAAVAAAAAMTTTTTTTATKKKPGKKKKRGKKKRKKTKHRKKTKMTRRRTPQESAIRLLRAAPEPWLLLVLPTPPIGNSWRQWRSRREEDREPRLPKPWYGSAARGWLDMLMREAPNSVCAVVDTLIERQLPPPPSQRGPRGNGAPLLREELLTLGALDTVAGWPSPAVAGSACYAGSLLMRAARWGCTDFVHYLVSLGADCGLQAVPPPPPPLRLWGFEGCDPALTVQVPMRNPHLVARLSRLGSGGEQQQLHEGGAVEGKHAESGGRRVHRCNPAAYLASWIGFTQAAAKALRGDSVPQSLRLKIDVALQQAPRPEQLGRDFPNRERKLAALWRFFGGVPRVEVERAARRAAERASARRAKDEKQTQKPLVWSWQPSIPAPAELPQRAEVLTLPASLRRVRMEARVAIARREFAIDQEVAAAAADAEASASMLHFALEHEDTTEDLLNLTHSVDHRGVQLQLHARRAGTALALHTLNRRRWAELELTACRADLPWIQLLEEACDAMRGNIGRPACWLTNVSKALKEVLKVMETYRAELTPLGGETGPSGPAQQLELGLIKLIRRLNVLSPMQMLEEAQKIVDAIVELRLSVADEKNVKLNATTTSMTVSSGITIGVAPRSSTDDFGAAQTDDVTPRVEMGDGEGDEEHPEDAPHQWSFGIDEVLSDPLANTITGTTVRRRRRGSNASGSSRRMHGSSHQRMLTRAFGETANDFGLGSPFFGEKLGDTVRLSSPQRRRSLSPRGGRSPTARVQTPSEGMVDKLAKWQSAKRAVRAQTADSVRRDQALQQQFLRSALHTAAGASRAARTVTLATAASSFESDNNGSSRDGRRSRGGGRSSVAAQPLIHLPYATMNSKFGGRLPSRPGSSSRALAQSLSRSSPRQSSPGFLRGGSSRGSDTRHSPSELLMQSRRKWTAGTVGTDDGDGGFRSASAANASVCAAPGSRGGIGIGGFPQLPSTPPSSSRRIISRKSNMKWSSRSGGGSSGAMRSSPRAAMSSRGGADGEYALNYDYGGAGEHDVDGSVFGGGGSAGAGAGGADDRAAMFVPSTPALLRRSSSSPNGSTPSKVSSSKTKRGGASRTRSPTAQSQVLLRGSNMDALLLACATTGDWRSAMLACQKAQSKNIPLRQMAFRRMAQACRSAEPARPDLIVQLMEMLLKERDWRKEGGEEELAKNFKSKKKEKKKLARTGGGYSGGNLVARALVSDCNVAIAACGACRSWRSALAVVRLMRDSGLDNQYTPATWVALRGAFKGATLSDVPIAFDSMIGNYDSWGWLDLILYNTTLRNLACHLLMN